MATGSKEGQKHDKTMRDFAGVNTQASRTMINDNEFSWLENVIPIGYGNLRAMPAVSEPLATWAPDICYFQQSANLNGIDYDYIFTTNGAGYQVNLTTFAVITFAPAATFSGAGTTMAQWQNTNIIIVDAATGYFSWDGATLTKWNGTLQSLTITNIGIDYTSVPTITIDAPGGGGTTATATSSIQVGLAALASGGVGNYVVGDLLTFTGGTFTEAAQVTVSSVSNVGVITGANLTNTGNYTVAPSNPVSFTGGYGGGGNFNLNFGIGPLVITDIGSGYTSTPTVTVTGGGGTLGTVTAMISVVPSVGSAIATYQDRVWVASGRTVIFSAPGNFTDFTTGNAGGSFIISDESLHSSVQALTSANNFLYIFGVTSVNVLSGVSVVSGATVFTNTNISADVGSAQPTSLVPFNRTVWFYTPYGFHGLFGSTTQKTSDKLDGVFPSIISTQNVTAGTCVIYNLRCIAFLFLYDDPIAGPRSLIALLYEKRWFFSSQRNDLTSMTSAIINDVPTLFGTDGTNLYQLFYDTETNVDQTIQTKLWDMDAPLREKQSLKFGLEHVVPTSPTVIPGTIDTEYANNNFAINLAGGNAIEWVNGVGATVNWVNGLGDVVSWIGSGYFFQALDVEISGFYLGVSLYPTAAGEIYQGIHLEYELRAHWP